MGRKLFGDRPIRTDDQGETWQEVPTLAVGEKSTLALTIDNGKTWQMQTAIKSDHLRAIRMQGSRAVILGAQKVYSIEVSPPSNQQVRSR